MLSAIRAPIAGGVTEGFPMFELTTSFVAASSASFPGARDRGLSSPLENTSTEPFFGQFADKISDPI
jgi:hypothetical protein